MATVAALYAGSQDFTIVNKTGFTITAFYAAPSKDRNWGEDILGEDELESGDHVDIKFSGYGSKTCKFDVMLKDPKDKEWIVEDIDLCEIHKLTFSRKGGGVQWEAN